jgi:1-acyl-sn-glycerol-3-phosphate acyltransferase
MVYWISRLFLKLVCAVYFPARCYGLEQIPRRGGFLVASNHLSYIDPLLLGIVMKPQLHFVGKESLFENKILGTFLRIVHVIPIKRESSDFGALREAIRRLRRGHPLLLFPEGARAGSKSVIRREGTAYAGIGFLAAKSGVPIIPVKIEGTDNVLPPGGHWLKRHPVSVVFGKPLSFSQKEAYPQVAEKIMSEIIALSIPQR